jgi:hypothetical protein
MYKAGLVFTAQHATINTQEPILQYNMHLQWIWAEINLPLFGLLDHQDDR